MAETVSVNIKISDNGSFKKVEVDADSLRDAVRHVKEEAEKLNAGVINLTQVSQVFDTIQQSFDELDSLVSDLSAAYAQQEEAETQLANNMRNTMGARAEDVESIKALCSVQQELGVIGDEVQLSGAQELATYLEKKSSLEQLIPVMNDMLAQQYGLNATQESAAQIASMLGKVMDGQVGALSRYGYTFDEAQEQILKFGSEEERAAVLAEVVESAVGGMNAELAKTDSGRQKQLANTLGDIKEKLGSMVQGIAPLVRVGAEFMIIMGNAGKCATSIKALAASFQLASAKSAILSMHVRVQSVAQRLLGASGVTAATGTWALNAAVAALYATLTMGVSLIISGLVGLFSSLGSSGEKAADGVDELTDSEQAYKSAASGAQEALTRDVQALKRLIDTNGDASDSVRDLNARYGEAFGYHRTAAEWYDVLMSKSQQYVMQLGYEAKAKALASRIAENEVQLQMDYDTRKEMWKRGKAQTSTRYMNGNVETRDTKEYTEIKQRDAQLIQETKQLKAELEIAQKKAEDLRNGLNGLNGRNGQLGVEAASMSYAELGRAIEANQQALSDLKPTETAEIGRLTRENALLTDQQQKLGKRLGLVKETAKANNGKGEGKASAYGEVTELDTLERIDIAIRRQQDLRSKAKAENLRGIDAEIARLNGLRRAFEEGSHVALSLEQIGTYEEIDHEIAFYEQQLRHSSGTERTEVQKQINELKRLRTTWDEELSELNAPGDISELNTMEELDNAISYYSTRQRRASLSEVEDIQRTIDKLDEKRIALQNITRLPSMQREMSGLELLNDEQLKVELELIGLDGVKSKIRELQKMLADTNLSDGQREEMRVLIAQWEDYGDELKRSQASLRDGWSNLKGIGSGVESITSAIEGNGNAWQRVTGLVDGMLGVYDGIRGVITLVDLLTGASAAHAAAKATEAVAVGTEQGVEEVAAEAAVVASAGQAAAAKVEASSWSAVAAAKTFAAHAYIPFAGTGIAAGFVATQQAIIRAASIPMFADGAIAYGPTLGIFGEYANARTNPEVVAPLDRLQQIIGLEGGVKGKVDFRIRARDLRGVLEKEYKHGRRS